MNTILEEIKQYGIIPVIKINQLENALPLAKALCDGGLPIAEITFRTSCASQAIQTISTAYPNMLVGAGTVLTVEQAKSAKDAGAKFIVSPGLNPKVVNFCVENNICIIPGCITPGEIEQAIALGLDTVKFFPAEAAGGIKMIKALSAPYKDIHFIPTGGIDEKNINEYLSFQKVIACGGSFMVSESLVDAKKFDEIAQITNQAMLHILGFELAHVGINASASDEAKEISSQFSTIFSLPIKDGSSSMFIGNMFEVMKSKYLGEHGHIAVKTNHIERAVSYLKQKGVRFDLETSKYNTKGELIAIYLTEQIGGFAVHLLQKI